MEPAAPAAQCEDHTPGQCEFLASLPAERRASWAAASDGRRRQMLAAHRGAFSSGVFKIQLAELAQIRPAAPIEQPPADTMELARRLADKGTPAHWGHIFANDLARDFNDQSLWKQHLLTAVGIQCGEINPEHVVDALRQGKNPAAKKPGAVYWIALQRNTGLRGDDIKRIGKGQVSMPGRW